MKSWEMLRWVSPTRTETSSSAAYERSEADSAEESTTYTATATVSADPGGLAHPRARYVCRAAQYGELVA